MKMMFIFILGYLFFYNVTDVQAQIQINNPTNNESLNCSDGKIDISGRLINFETPEIQQITCNDRLVKTDKSDFLVKRFQLRKPGLNVITCSYTDDGNSYSETINVHWRTRLKAPIANFTTQTIGNGPVTVKFNADQSVDTDGKIVDYNWDLGDGRKAKGKKIEAVYAIPGFFQVKLIVTDNLGLQGEHLVTINANPTNTAPIAQFVWNEMGVIQGAAYVVHFDATQSFDPEGANLRYQWTVDGEDRSGGFVISPNIDLTFWLGQTSNVTLTVQDGTGLTDRTTKQIFHINQPPVANFFMYQLTGGAPVTASFDASQSIDPEQRIVSYHWNFDNVHTETTTTPNIDYHYTSAGEHNVTLTVTDDHGFSSTKSLKINIP